MKVEGNLALKEEPLEEIIGGKVVMMAPPLSNHNRLARNLAGIFTPYLRGKTCEYFGDHEGVFLTEGEYYIPDGMVVCDPGKIDRHGVHGAPDLVIEILSRSTIRNDRGLKKEMYEAAGVREYWIVNPSDMTIEQYLLRDGQLILNDVYQKYQGYELEDMKEEERAAIVTEFRCSLFPDLPILVEDVFDHVTLLD